MTWEKVVEYIEQHVIEQHVIPEILHMMSQKRYFPYNGILQQQLAVMMIRLQEARNQEEKERMSA